LPREIDATARSAFARDFPDRVIWRTAATASSDTQWVVRVFYRADFIPPPYSIYRVEVPAMTAVRLEGDEAKPYRIANYR
jgi:hypothetical protein